MANIIKADGLFYGEKIAALSDEAKQKFVFFYLQSDDWGCGEINAERMRARAFARWLRRPRLDTVEELLAEYRSVGLLKTWEADGKTWGEWVGPDGRLPKFDKRTRRKTPVPPWHAGNGNAQPEPEPAPELPLTEAAPEPEPQRRRPPTQAKDKPAASGAHKQCYEYAYEDYKFRRAGVTPTWDGSDAKALQGLLKRGVLFERFKAAWDRFANSTQQFDIEQGLRLRCFCSLFHKYDNKTAPGETAWTPQFEGERNPSTYANRHNNGT